MRGLVPFGNDCLLYHRKFPSDTGQCGRYRKNLSGRASQADDQGTKKDN